MYAIVLAAGSASRFGATKQLADYRGEALVRRAGTVAEHVCGACSVLVTGADHLNVIRARPLERGFLVHNEKYDSGMASSIACGIRSIATLADYAMLLLADQPLITTAHLEGLVRRCVAYPDTIVASRYAGTLGPPVIFPQKYFGPLMRLQGDQGARALLVKYEDQLQALRFEDAAVDIDRPEDLTQLH